MPPRTANVQIRRATEKDYPAIARVQSEAPEAAQWPLGDYSNFPAMVAELLPAAAIVGFCAYRQSAPDEAELLNLAVAPEWRGQGIGSALVAAVCRLASGTIYLEVAEDNVLARQLYASQGWTVCGMRPGYYSQGKINAVVMKKGSC